MECKQVAYYSEQRIEGVCLLFMLREYWTTGGGGAAA